MGDYLKYLYGNSVLKDVFKYVLENNKGFDNPYHNNQHLLNVFNNVMNMASYYELPKNDKLELGLAALFHDFNHSGGKLKDDENIEIAIKGLKDFSEAQNDIDSIIDLISYTEFPHKEKPTTIQQQILVDSDLIGIFQLDDWFNGIIIALSKEYGNTIDKQIDDQIKFMESLELNTEYGKLLQENKSQKIISELRYLKTIFN